jgi:hypothetical protein
MIAMHKTRRDDVYRVCRFMICPVAAFCVFMATGILLAASATRLNWRAQSKTDTDAGFRIPNFELSGKLAKIFKLSNCEYISGITCRIHYNGVLPLPSQVFFTEFDERGQQAAVRVRLIYPKLAPGETGRATFRIRSGRPAKVVLEAEWKGPWRDPY